MEAGKVILGTIAGIAIGAAIGVLMAPDKGSETRRRLSEKGSGAVGGLKNKYEGLKEKYNGLVDDVTSKIESMTGSENGAHENGSMSGARTASAGAGMGGNNAGGNNGAK